MFETNEHLLYFFINGKVSLSQYDYKFMSNLQTMIKSKGRVTSNQAALFNSLIGKYKRQLVKQGLKLENLETLTWNTEIVESSEDYTSANISLAEDEIIIRVPFQKNFITNFRHLSDNPFSWIKEEKVYKSAFSTTALKICATEVSKYFETVKFDETLQKLVTEINAFAAPIYDPTYRIVNGRPIIGAINEVLGNLISDMSLAPTGENLFKLSQLGINVDPLIYESNDELRFASMRTYETEVTQLPQVVHWMKSVGCKNVFLGRGMKGPSTEFVQSQIMSLGMNVVGPMQIGASLPSSEGISMLIQHVRNYPYETSYVNNISKTIVLRDSRSIEVK